MQNVRYICIIAYRQNKYMYKNFPRINLRLWLSIKKEILHLKCFIFSI